jgi:uncharacterized protein (TIGR03086 family)
METTADRYDRLATAFATVVAAVPADRWDASTPCPDWNARDVVRHVVDSQNLFLGLVGKPPVVAPSVDDDPVAAWATTSGAVLADLRDPVAATIEFDGFFGRTNFTEAVDRFLCLDLVIHRWDLAHGVGLDDSIADDDVALVMAGVEQMGDAIRGEGAFGPALDPPPGADAQARMLAFLGRQP